MDMKWVEGFEIRVTVDGGEALISANREGLLSLAKQLAPWRKPRRAAISTMTATALWKTAPRR